MEGSPGYSLEHVKTMNYYNYEYAKPIEVKGGIRAGSKTRRLRLQLVGKTMELQTLEEFSIGRPPRTGAVPMPAGDRSSPWTFGQEKSPPGYRAPANVPTTWASRSGPSRPPDWERLQEAMAEAAHHRRQSPVRTDARQHRGHLPLPWPFDVPRQAG